MKSISPSIRRAKSAFRFRFAAVCGVVLHFAVVSLSFSIVQGAAPTLRRELDPSDASVARSVRAADGPLAWTGQIYGWNDAGTVGGSAAHQAESALARLRIALAAAGSDFERVVRINAYVVTDEIAPVLVAALKKGFAGHMPSLTVVATPLAESGALLALDAVAAVATPATKLSVLAVDGLPPKATGRHVSVVPAGRKVFISGQAEPAENLRLATRLTMASLGRSLAHLGVEKTAVVQVKAFLQPFAQHRETVEEIAAFFEGGPVPPVVLMAWTSELPTEIELVAAGGTARAPVAGEPIWFSTLPNLAASPRFSRAAIVEPGVPLIFTSGLVGSAGEGARAELRDIFAQLGSLLFDAGSSYRYLVKATYFNRDAMGPKVLAEVRGVYFDPTRPPAASSVGVSTLGVAGRVSSLDMIAVPAPVAK